jgi:hypothetical protein
MVYGATPSGAYIAEFPEEPAAVRGSQMVQF